MHRERIDWQWHELQDIEDLYDAKASAYEDHDEGDKKVDHLTFVKKWTQVWTKLQEHYFNSSRRSLTETSVQGHTTHSKIQSVTEHRIDGVSDSMPLDEKHYQVERCHILPRKKSQGGKNLPLVVSGIRHKVKIRLAGLRL